jgi:hypothetical protein
VVPNRWRGTALALSDLHRQANCRQEEDYVVMGCTLEDDHSRIDRLALIFDVAELDILEYEDGYFAFDNLSFPKSQLKTLIWTAIELYWDD